MCLCASKYARGFRSTLPIVHPCYIGCDDALQSASKCGTIQARYGKYCWSGENDSSWPHHWCLPRISGMDHGLHTIDIDAIQKRHAKSFLKSGGWVHDLIIDVCLHWAEWIVDYIRLILIEREVLCRYKYVQISQQFPQNYTVSSTIFMMTFFFKVLLSGTVALVAALSQSHTNGTSRWFGMLLLSRSHDLEASIFNFASWQLQILSFANEDLGVSHLGTIQAPKIEKFVPGSVCQNLYFRLL